MSKVSEMKAEYFPPKEDVILQNEAPTDFYILVTGAVVKPFFFVQNPCFSIKCFTSNFSIKLLLIVVVYVV